MGSAAEQTEVRLAELLASFSLVVDLGLGQPMEHVLRQTLVALRLGDVVGLSGEDRAALYYIALLAWVGCGSDSHELATHFGDDLEWRAASYEIDPVGPEAVAFLSRRAAAVHPPLAPATPRQATGSSTVFEHCVVTRQFAERVGLGEAVARPLVQLFERWDGRGRPDRLHGAEISILARIVQLADIVVPVHRMGGVSAAVDVVRERTGSQWDPELADAFCAHATDILAAAAEPDCWESVLAEEPTLRSHLTAEELDAALEAIGDFTDLKSPFTTGHARGVAGLAAEAARALGLPDEETQLIRRTALVQDAGRMGVSNSILDKPGPLTTAETERLQMHAYYVGRMFRQPATLARIGALAAQHHERLDGSGYPHGRAGGQLSMAARVLGAADTYQALVENRADRPAYDAATAAGHLRSEVRAGGLDADAVGAVLAAAGQTSGRRRTWPCGLTSREVEVLALIARGHTTRAVANRLHVAEKTVGNHVEHIYAKIGSSTRAEASLFAMRYGLLDSASAFGQQR
ncbi:MULTISPECIES: HD domain-containing phosphohydrolase [Nocardioides]|uniref:HD domain-containing phosphohydrolase n=1 Tax=Nocardioides vastitatis TaxID=2568655 RepID=A0ABW0ZNF4_9ACTN|nr:HD domain-containing phosphohydrolase [Nocardioides sp.]THJ07465.1 HD domain-containing protein [Nocardioides sp.]